MKTLSVYLNRLLALAIAAALSLGGLSAAQAIPNNSPAWGLISQKGTLNPIYDAIRLTLGDPADPSTYKNLIYVNMDVQYNYQSYAEWESATWRPASSFPGRRFPASLLGTDNYTDPMEGRYIQLRNLTIDHADLDAQNVEFRFSPFSVPAGNTSLTLNDGSLVSLNIPGFNANALFTLTASGDSRITGWTGRIASQTTLNVKPGATLTIDDCGDMYADLITSTMYFGEIGNTATVDGGTLRLHQSNVTFGKLSPPSGGPYGQMTFKNNARLEVTGDHSKIESDMFDFINSSLKLANGNRLKVRTELTLNAASVDIGDSGEIHAVDIVSKGNSTVALPQVLGGFGGPAVQPVTTELMFISPNAILTLTGRGGLEVTSNLLFGVPAPGQQYGQIIIDDNAELIGSGDARFDLRSHDAITLTRTSADVFGLMIAKNGGTISYGGTDLVPSRFTNHGGIAASDDGRLDFRGQSTIQGGSEGYVEIGDGGVLGIGTDSLTPAVSRLTTNNEVFLLNFSTLQLTLDPTNRINDQLRAGSLLEIDGFADLNLSLVNDQALPNGTKFVLIDYAALGGTSSHPSFQGYPDGSTFVLGSNHYRMNYHDTDQHWHNSSAITLTVVSAVPPTASLSPPTQTLNGAVGVSFTSSATLMPSGFGGMVTYSIIPGLPSGLKLDFGTGVISGYAAQAIPLTTFTITGVGSTSGIAAATVDITIASGSQTITFGPPPAPTFAPGGAFLVAAAATSGLPVTFSSQTPLVCTTIGSNNGIMLTAGICTIAADQGGNDNYDAAPQVTQSITIAKAQPAPLTLSANPPNISVDDGSGTTALSTSGGGGTKPIIYGVSGPCTILGDTLTGTGPGTCIVSATQAADDNYEAGHSNPLNVQVGTGAQDHLVLTASPASFSVNGTSALSTTGGGGSGTVTYAVNSGPCTITPPSTLTATVAGKCQVVAAKAASGTYGAATSNPVTVTVNLLVPAALVLTAAPTSIGFGGTSMLSTAGGIPAATVSYQVTGPCYVAANSLVGTSAGSCQVTATEAETSSYTAATSNTVTAVVKERTTVFSYPPATVTLGLPFMLRPITAGFINPTFALLYGSLPAGLTLDPTTGAISGKPTGPAGTIDAVITVFENNAYDAAIAVFTVQSTSAPLLSEYGLALLVMLLMLVFGWSQRKTGIGN